MTTPNKELGYAKVHAISEGSGHAGAGLTAHLILGRKDNHYRAYAYLFHHEQDASREGITDSLCGRGDSAVEAMAVLQDRAADQWTDEENRGLRRALIEVADSIDEDGEQESSNE